MEKVKAKIADQQAKLKELEQKHREAENEEIVDIVRGMSVSLSDLPGLLQAVKAASGNLGGPRQSRKALWGEEMQRSVRISGHFVPKEQSEMFAATETQRRRQN